MKLKAFAALLLACVLTACGGGGGSGGGGASPSPGLSVSLSSASGSASATEGATGATLTTTAMVSGAVSTPVVTNLQFDNTVFSSVTATAGTAGAYTVTAQIQPNLGGGEYKGNITFRLCQDAACTNVYSGTTVSYAYDILVTLKDWQTYQRDNAHSGYVHATLDPTKFAKAWQWSPAINSAISPVVTGNGRIYFSAQQNGSTASTESQLIALNESDGSVAFNTSLNAPQVVGLPSVYGGIVYLGDVSSSQAGAVTAYDATSGTALKTFTFLTQWSAPYSPVVSNGNVVFLGGEFGSALYDYNYMTGANTWTANTVNTIDGSSVAATDGTFAYYYSGQDLEVFNLADGTLAKKILDPYQTWNGYSYDSGVMLGSANDAIALSGTTSFPAPTTINNEHYSPRPLVSYGMNTNAITWKTSNAYFTNPAINNNVIYIARDNGSSLDAINEADGTILWSWTPPAGEIFHRNTIVTDNLVFVSTDKAVYAISLTDHTSKWSYPMPGTLSISANFMLYISADYVQPQAGISPSIAPARSLGEIVAIKLN